MNKKAETTFNILIWIPRAFFLIFILLSVVYVLNVHLNMNLNDSLARAKLFKYTMLSSDCFSYYDENIDQVKPYSVDINKFKNIDSCIDTKKYSAKFEVISSKYNKTTYYKKKLYDDMIVRTGFTGKNSVYMYTSINYIFVYNITRIPAFLRSTILVEQ